MCFIQKVSHLLTLSYKSPPIHLKLKRDKALKKYSLMTIKSLMGIREGKPEAKAKQVELLPGLEAYIQPDKHLGVNRYNILGISVKAFT